MSLATSAVIQSGVQKEWSMYLFPLFSYPTYFFVRKNIPYFSEKKHPIFLNKKTNLVQKKKLLNSKSNLKTKLARHVGYPI